MTEQALKAPQVLVTNLQSDVKIQINEVETLVHLVLKSKKVQCEEVSVHFVDVETICQMHDEFFNDPTPTDCISFPMDDEDDASGYRILGEVFVCPKVALEYAEEHKKTPEKELSLYVVHGLLHLLGLDDIDPKDRAKMRREERKALLLLEEHSALLTIS